MNLISVIIPTFNRAKTLTRTIESVIFQDFSNWELIIVDDGSTDNTKEIIEINFIGERIFYFLKENQGVSAARNFGASKASGEWLIFLDSDDELDKDFFKNLEKAGINDKYNFYFFNSLIRTCDGKVRIKKSDVFNIESLLSGNSLIKKDFFYEVGGYDKLLTYSENTELGIRLLNYNLKFKHLDFISLHYNLDGTLERKKKYYNKKKKSAIYILMKHPEFFNNRLISKVSYLKIISYCALKTSDYFSFLRYGILYLINKWQLNDQIKFY